MYKTREINDVWRFVSQVSESEVVFLNSKKSLIIYENDIRKELLSNKSEVVEEWRNGFLINENKFYTEGKLESLLNENTFKVLIINNNELLIKYLDYEKEEVKYGVFSYSSKAIEWLVGFAGFYPRILTEHKHVIATADTLIQSFSRSGNVTWSHSYSELTQSDKANLHTRIIEADNKLFFGIDGNENRGIFVLDTDTGKLLKKFDTESYEIFRDGNYIYTTLFEDILCRINIQTLELEKWDVRSLIEENGFHSIHDHRCEAHNNKFYFTQSIGDGVTRLGVLDYETKELCYKYEFKNGSGAIGSIRVNDTRIFVHTQDNTLHIFEKETNSTAV